MRFKNRANARDVNPRFGVLFVIHGEAAARIDSGPVSSAGSERKPWDWRKHPDIRHDETHINENYFFVAPWVAFYLWYHQDAYYIQEVPELRVGRYNWCFCPNVASRNILILYFLSSRDTVMSSNQTGAKTKRAETRCIINLIALTFNYMIFMGPNAVAWSIYIAQYYSYGNADPAVVSVAWFSTSLIQGNFSLNSLLYLCFLPFFRTELFKIFCGSCIAGKKWCYYYYYYYYYYYSMSKLNYQSLFYGFKEYNS
jgi:hypothetical protein